MRKILKMLLICIGICGISLLTGCGYTAEEKAQMAAYEKQGSKNAVSYIKEKYGIQAKVENATAQKISPGPIPDFFPAASGEVLVAMTYEGHDFEVLIDGTEECSDGQDNYEFDVIKKAIMSEICTSTGYEPISYDVYFGSMIEPGTHIYNGMISERYSGNLYDILNDKNLRIIISYLNKDLSLIQDETYITMFGDNTRLVMVSYETMEDYQVCANNKFNITGTPINQKMERCAIYIKEAYVLEGKGTYYPFDLYDFDDIKGYCYEQDKMMQMSKDEMDDASNFTGYGMIHGTQVSDAYRVESDSYLVYLYFPIAKVEKKYQDKDLILGYQYDKDGERCYQVMLCDLSPDGKYLVGSIPIRSYENVIFSVYYDDEEKQ